MECNDLPNDVFKDNSKVKVKSKVNSNKNIKRKTQKGEVKEVEEDDMDNIVVYLHEDVADSSCGGGDGGFDVLEDVLEDGGPDVADPDVADFDAVDPDVVVDPDVDPEPADLVPASDDDDSDADDQYDPAPQPSRRSVRFSRAPKVFSYDEIGGPPVLIDINR